MFDFFKKKNIECIDPKNSIRYDGCMGFKIGDSENFVLSRIAHLGIMNDDEEMEYKNEKEYEYPWGFSITTCSGRYNGIKNMVLSITNGMLRSITIYFDYPLSEISLRKRELTLDLSKNLGPLFIDDAKHSTWKNVNRIVDLSIESGMMYINISNQLFN